MEVLLQTYIRVLQLKNNEENGGRVGERNVYGIADHVKTVRPQQVLAGPWQDNGVRG
jgi:hypothetical protein